MKTRGKWTFVLAGAFIVAVLSFGLFGTQRGAESRIRWIIDDLAYYVRTGQNRPKVSVCKWNLGSVEICKKMWASDHGKTTNDVPTWDDLRIYFRGRALKGIPICPEGGTYNINRVGERPTCSIGGSRHSLPALVPEDGASSSKAK